MNVYWIIYKPDGTIYATVKCSEEEVQKKVENLGEGFKYEPED